MSELLAIAAVLVLSSAFGEADPTPVPADGAGDRAQLDRVLARLPAALAWWRRALLVIASHESRCNRHIARGIKAGAPDNVAIVVDESEAEAALAMYNRNRTWFVGSPWPRARYVFGAGGWFQSLPTVALAGVGASRRAAVSPWDAVFSPGLSIALELDTLRRLQGYASYRDAPTFARLLFGLGGTAAMVGELDEAKLEEWRESCRRVDVDPAILLEQPPPLPRLDPLALAAALGE